LAAAQVDPTLAVRDLAHRAVTQVVDPDGLVVLSAGVNSAVCVDVPHETTRLVPGAADAPVWWVEAWVPWDDAGDRGRRIMCVFANMVDAQLYGLDDGRQHDSVASTGHFALEADDSERRVTAE
jgi:hypothetical protein